MSTYLKHQLPHSLFRFTVADLWSVLGKALLSKAAGGTEYLRSTSSCILRLWRCWWLASCGYLQGDACANTHHFRIPSCFLMTFLVSAKIRTPQTPSLPPTAESAFGYSSRISSATSVQLLPVYTGCLALPILVTLDIPLAPRFSARWRVDDSRSARPAQDSSNRFSPSNQQRLFMGWTGLIRPFILNAYVCPMHTCASFHTSDSMYCVVIYQYDWLCLSPRTIDTGWPLVTLCVCGKRVFGIGGVSFITCSYPVLQGASKARCKRCQMCHVVSVGVMWCRSRC